MENRQQLARYFKELGFRKGAEVGVLGGTYSVELCQNGLKVFCIDSWGLGERRYRKYHLRKYEEAKLRLALYDCVLIRNFSMEAVKEFGKETLDFVYIDAKHQFDYVMQDIIEWTKIIRVGGIVAGHDYERPSVKEAVELYTRHHDYKLNLTEDNNWYFIKDK